MLADYQVLGECAPLHPKDLAGLNLSAYVTKLLSELGPGLILDEIELLDPRTERFAVIQERFELMRMLRPGFAQEKPGIVFALRRTGGMFVDCGGELLVSVSPDGSSRTVTPNHGFPAQPWEHVPPYPFAAVPSKSPVLAALIARDEAAADAALAAILPSQSAWVLLELAHDLALDGSLPIAPELRGQYFAECARFAKRFRDHDLPVREIQKDLSDGQLSQAHAALVRETAYIESPVSGPIDPEERALVREVTAARDQAIVLADYLEDHDQPLRARLVREATTGKREGDHGALERVATWRDAWTSEAPDLDLAPLETILAAITDLDACVTELGTWRVDAAPGRLTTDPNAFAILIFALRSVRKDWSTPRYSDNAIELLAKNPNPAARPWLMSIIRAPPAFEQELENRLELAAELVGKLSKSELDEALGWVEADRFPSVAMAMLVKHHKDSRVLEVALSRFFSGHPYSERIVAKYKTDPAVLASLREKFEAQHKACMVDNGRQVRYTQRYKIIARFLAKLGDADAKASWDRVKRMRLVDDAAANREARRDGM